MKFFHVFILFLGLSTFPLAYSIGGAVLGIDFGAEFYKISLISNGKAFAIIENTSSKRKTPTSISFIDGQRQYEYEAANKKTRYPENTFLYMKKFLGALKNNEKILELSGNNFEEFLSVFDDERQSWKFQLKQFKLDDDSDDIVDDIVYLHVEEIIAMILRHGKKMAEQFAQLDQITDCVITIPSNWNLDQRNMMIEAAKLAGLIPVGLIKENTAAALQYAIDKKDQKTKEKILFYNLGASQLQLSIADINYAEIQDKATIKKKQILVKIVNILADSVNIDVSSQKFDQVLANYFAGLFDETKNRIGKTSIKQTAKSMLKLLKQSETIKEKLSANKEAHLYQENLQDGEDFQTIIHRSTFEQESQKLMPDLIQPIDQILIKANLTTNDINQVEMIGGGVRIPLVQKIIEDYFGADKMGFHLNGDESMALGAAFMAANLSNDIRVRPLWLSDGYDFSLKLNIQSMENSEIPSINKSIILFPKRVQINQINILKAPIGSKKAITFESSENIKMQVFQVDEFEDQEKLLFEYQFLEIADLLKNKKYAQCNNPKLHFKFRLNSIDPVIIEKADAILKEKKIQQNKDTEKNEESEEDTDNQTSEDNQETNETNKTKQQKKIPKEYKITLKTKILTTGLKGLTNDQIKASKALLRKFDSHELFVQKNSQSKNTLESLIYKAQELINNEKFKKYSTKEEIIELIQLIEQNEDWLYTEEAKQANYIEVTKRVDAINFLINQIDTRREEAKNRPQEIKNALKKLDDKEKKLMNLFNRTLPWVKYEDKKPVVEMIRMTRTWIQEKKSEQDKKKINQDPAFLLVDMNKKMKRVIDEYDKIRNTPNPNQGKKEENPPKSKKFKEDKQDESDKKQKKEENIQKKENQKNKDKKPKLDKDEL